MNFEPVETLEELMSLDQDKISDGYRLGTQNAPEPTTEDGKALWHGWRNGMIDKKFMPADEAYYALARLFVADRNRVLDQ
jgi:hypothetical protein